MKEPTNIDWLALLKAYMQAVFDDDEIVAQQNDELTGVSNEAREWMRAEYNRMSREAGLLSPGDEGYEAALEALEKGRARGER